MTRTDFTRGQKYQVEFKDKAPIIDTEILETEVEQLDKLIKQWAFDDKISVTNCFQYKNEINLDHIQDQDFVSDFRLFEFGPENYRRDFNQILSFQIQSNDEPVFKLEKYFSINEDMISMFKLKTEIIDNVWNFYFFKLGKLKVKIDFYGIHFK